MYAAQALVRRPPSRTRTPTQWRWRSATCEVKSTLQSSVFLPFIQHHTCPSRRIRMETSLWRYCKPSKQALQGGMTHSPELLQLRNMLCLYFPAPLICQSSDSANRLGLLVFVLRICPARLLPCFGVSQLAKTQCKRLDCTHRLLASEDLFTLVPNFTLDKLGLSATGGNPLWGKTFYILSVPLWVQRLFAPVNVGVFFLGASLAAATFTCTPKIAIKPTWDWIQKEISFQKREVVCAVHYHKLPCVLRLPSMFPPFATASCFLATGKHGEIEAKQSI